jgi:two-component system sensor histidine kinase VicK
MGYADTLLEKEYDKETQDKFLNVIATEARRMAKLVTDLLTLSRYDNNKKTTQKETFDLGDLVKKCKDKLAIEAKKKNHNVNCFVTADVPPVYADKYDIERVVLNILSNSIKYTKEGGEIKIYVGFVYNDAYIKVFDNGIGIPEEDLSRIFERFYRVDKARTREMGGTGLGLSIAKEILDKNGGSIDIKSVVGQGTEVVIKIPTKQDK